MSEDRRTTDDEILRRLQKIDDRFGRLDERLSTLETDMIARNAVLRFLKLAGAVVVLVLTLKWGDVPRLLQSLGAMVHGGNGG